MIVLIHKLEAEEPQMKMVITYEDKECIYDDVQGAILQYHVRVQVFYTDLGEGYEDNPKFKDIDHGRTFYSYLGHYKCKDLDGMIEASHKLYETEEFDYTGDEHSDVVILNYPIPHLLGLEENQMADINSDYEIKVIDGKKTLIIRTIHVVFALEITLKAVERIITDDL